MIDVIFVCPLGVRPPGCVGHLRGVSFRLKMRGVLFCVTHSGPRTPNRENEMIFLLEFKIIFQYYKGCICLPIRGPGSRVCRAFWAVFHSCTKYVAHGKAPGAVFYSDTELRCVVSL